MYKTVACTTVKTVACDMGPKTVACTTVKTVACDMGPKTVACTTHKTVACVMLQGHYRFKWCVVVVLMYLVLWHVCCSGDHMALWRFGALALWSFGALVL